MNYLWATGAEDGLTGNLCGHDPTLCCAKHKASGTGQENETPAAVTSSVIKVVLLDFGMATTQPAQPMPPKPFINTRSAHEVRKWLRNAVSLGRIKKCWYLEVYQYSPRKMEGGEIVDAGMSFFAPKCRHQSFEHRYTGCDDETLLSVLQYHLQDDPINCPQNCTWYRNNTWAGIRFHTWRAWKRATRNARGVWKEYAGLHWQTQVALITMPTMVLILWKAPSWVPHIIALARALWGKP